MAKGKVRLDTDILGEGQEHTVTVGMTPRRLEAMGDAGIYLRTR